MTDPRWIIQLGVAPVRIDLMSELPGGPDFSVAWEHRVEARFGTVGAHYLGLDDLIHAKEASGRTQDLADLEALKRVRKKTPRDKRPKHPAR